MPEKIWTHAELDRLIVKIVARSIDRRIRTADIVSAMKAKGVPGHQDGVIKAAIQRCKRAGKIAPLQRGIYTTAFDGDSDEH